MYLELYIYFTDNNVILFTLDDPDKDIHTINLYKYNLILYKTKCSINDIYITANKIIKQFNLKQTLNDPDYNILYYYQMITLQCNHNLFDEFLYNFN